MGNTATEKMLEAVRAARASASRAEREYDSGESLLQMKASRSIDLFDGSAVGRVADIARDARRLCDDLYASYQQLVQMLDQQCRPLLDQDPELHAVKEVRDLIKWLNDESEIETNFTASFNSQSLGGVASGRYVPSIDNKVIQRFWENKYDLWPGRAEAELEMRRRREEAAAAERRRREAEAERRRQEAEKQNRAAEEKYQAELAAYNKAYDAWSEEVEAVLQRRKEGVEKALPPAKEAKLKEIKAKYRAEKERILHEQAVYQQNQAAAQAELESLGLFHFTEKKTEKRIIADMAYRLAAIPGRLQAADAAYTAEVQEVETWLKSKRKQYQKAMEKTHPLPEEPKKPKKPRPALVPSADMTPMQIANEGLKGAIYDGMEPGKLYTITDIAEGIPAVSELSNQRVSALMRQMVSDGLLTRTEDRRKAYFSRD